MKRHLPLVITCLYLNAPTHADWASFKRAHIDPVVKKADQTAVDFDKNVLTPTGQTLDEGWTHFKGKHVDPRVKALDEELVKFDRETLQPLGEDLKGGWIKFKSAHIDPAITALDEAAVDFDRDILTPTGQSIDKGWTRFKRENIDPSVRDMDHTLVNFDEDVLQPTGNAFSKGWVKFKRANVDPFVRKVDQTAVDFDRMVIQPFLDSMYDMYEDSEVSSSNVVYAEDLNTPELTSQVGDPTRLTLSHKEVKSFLLPQTKELTLHYSTVPHFDDLFFTDEGGLNPDHLQVLILNYVKAEDGEDLIDNGRVLKLMDRFPNLRILEVRSSKVGRFEGDNIVDGLQAFAQMKKALSSSSTILPERLILGKNVDYASYVQRIFNESPTTP
jgi:hypothetical protein